MADQEEYSDDEFENAAMEEGPMAKTPAAEPSTNPLDPQDGADATYDVEFEEDGATEEEPRAAMEERREMLDEAPPTSDARDDPQSRGEENSPDVQYEDEFETAHPTLLDMPDDRSTSPATSQDIPRAEIPDSSDCLPRPEKEREKEQEVQVLEETPEQDRKEISVPLERVVSPMGRGSSRRVMSWPADDSAPTTRQRSSSVPEIELVTDTNLLSKLQRKNSNTRSRTPSISRLPSLGELTAATPEDLEIPSTTLLDAPEDLDPFDGGDSGRGRMGFASRLPSLQEGDLAALVERMEGDEGGDTTAEEGGQQPEMKEDMDPEAEEQYSADDGDGYSSDGSLDRPNDGAMAPELTTRGETISLPADDAVGEAKRGEELVADHNHDQEEEERRMQSATGKEDDEDAYDDEFDRTHSPSPVMSSDPGDFANKDEAGTGEETVGVGTISNAPEDPVRAALDVLQQGEYEGYGGEEEWAVDVEADGGEQEDPGDLAAFDAIESEEASRRETESLLHEAQLLLRTQEFVPSDASAITTASAEEAVNRGLYEDDDDGFGDDDADYSDALERPSSDAGPTQYDDDYDEDEDARQGRGEGTKEEGESNMGEHKTEELSTSVPAQNTAPPPPSPQSEPAQSTSTAAEAELAKAPPVGVTTDATSPRVPDASSSTAAPTAVPTRPLAPPPTITPSGTGPRPSRPPSRVSSTSPTRPPSRPPRTAPSAPPPRKAPVPRQTRKASVAPPPSTAATTATGPEEEAPRDEASSPPPSTKPQTSSSPSSRPLHHHHHHTETAPGGVVVSPSSPCPSPRKAPVFKQPARRPRADQQQHQQHRLRPVKCPASLRIELPAHVDRDKREWLLLNMFKHGDDVTKYEPFMPSLSPVAPATAVASRHEAATRPRSARQIYFAEAPELRTPEPTRPEYSRRGRRLRAQQQRPRDPALVARERNWVGTRPHDSAIPTYDSILDRFCKTVTSPVVQRQIYETRYDDLSPQLALVLEKRAFKEWKLGQQQQYETPTAFGAVSSSYKAEIVPTTLPTTTRSTHTLQLPPATRPSTTSLPKDDGP